MEPKISVIIPVYNVERYLQECINSLLNQSLEDLELIFVNDASPDNCLEILEANKKIYPDKIKIVNLEKNSRQGGARNAGIKIAKAPYIGFVDSDDFINPNMYDVLYQKIVSVDADAAFVQATPVSEKARLSEVLNSIEKTPYIKWGAELLELDSKELNEVENGHLKLLSNIEIGGVWCGVWKKDVILDNNIFFPERIRYEDNYWISLIKCYLNKVAFIDEVYYYYRQNSASTVRARNAKYHLDRIEIENMLLNEVKNRNLYEMYYNIWEYIYIERYAFNTISLLLTKFSVIPRKDILFIRNNLNTEFPNWKKNIYFKEQKKMLKLYKMCIIILPEFLIKNFVRLLDKIKISNKL